MSGAQYLRQLLSPLGVYDLEGPFQNGELEALGAALDQAEDALDELHRESCPVSYTHLFQGASRVLTVKAS